MLGKNYKFRTAEPTRFLFFCYTLKNAAVEPPLSAPYFIFVCFARSSALSIGESILSTVKNAAKLAVYDEIMMSVKNHHIPATIRVDTALGSKETGYAVTVGYFSKACRLLSRRVKIDPLQLTTMNT